MKMEASKAVIKNSDMSEQMQQKAVDYAKQGMDQYGIEKEVASHVKKAFDREFGPTWHCVVGRNFGSYVTHEANCFIYFYLKSIANIGNKVADKTVDKLIDMQQKTVKIAQETISRNLTEKDTADVIKKEFDTRYGQEWHCIVGRYVGR
ncbi:unnamed protein product [Rodentolepis nana]|uniref:Dynein light chain n=1 Tax=Rodentolepis nana TaxID=102285 RepID=A0A0R3T0P9_RODNA|nr:unnamed protein product [Rodentolepis nana]